MQPHPEFDYRQLSLEERLQLVEDIWDSIAAEATPNSLPLTDEERALLDERLDAHERDPAGGRPWEEVRERILKRGE